VITPLTMPRTQSIQPRRGRPPKNSWFNPQAAHGRLQELDLALQALEAERALLQQILSGAGALVAQRLASLPGARRVAAAIASRRRGRRRGRNGGPSLLDIIEKIMQGQPSRRWTVGELRDEMLKVAPDRASAGNASALISSALVQALRAKAPRFSGSRGGRGHARKYRLATRRAAAK